MAEQKSFLDEIGLAHLWASLKGKLSGKAATDLSNVGGADFMAKAQASGALPIVTTEGDGAAYTATVDGVTTLKAGVAFIMIPHVVSSAVMPTLNVNGLGAKNIRRRVSNSTVSTVTASSANWLGANKPILMTYDGTFWIADFARPNAADIYGTMPIVNGGTGATTAEAALTNLGAAPAGYGLGVIKDITVDALDGTLSNGWYRIVDQSLTVAGYTCTNWHIHVSKYGSTYLVQEMYPLVRGYNYKLIRWCSAGTWTEEWVNPPMQIGVEYRTTERMQGKAVYKKADSNGNISYRLDGETIWYPERTQIIKLWENAIHTSTFAAQTISLDLSKYQMVAIEYRYNTTDDYRKTYLGRVGSDMALDVVSTSGYLGWRSATVSTTGISFSAATFNENNNVVGYVIPVAIYGIKGTASAIVENPDNSGNV